MIYFNIKIFKIYLNGNNTGYKNSRDRKCTENQIGTDICR